MSKVRAKWELAGYISVDAGVIKIGDPCYGECDFHGIDLDSLVNEIPHDGRLKAAGDAQGFGQAVIVQSGFGDGIYAVEVKRDTKFNAIREVRIKFF